MTWPVPGPCAWGFRASAWPGVRGGESERGSAREGVRQRRGGGEGREGECARRTVTNPPATVPRRDPHPSPLRPLNPPHDRVPAPNREVARLSPLDPHARLVAEEPRREARRLGQEGRDGLGRDGDVRGGEGEGGRVGGAAGVGGAVWAVWAGARGRSVRGLSGAGADRVWWGTRREVGAGGQAPTGARRTRTPLDLDSRRDLDLDEEEGERNDPTYCKSPAQHAHSSP